MLSCFDPTMVVISVKSHHECKQEQKLKEFKVFDIQHLDLNHNQKFHSYPMKIKFMMLNSLVEIVEIYLYRYIYISIIILFCDETNYYISVANKYI